MRLRPALRFPHGVAPRVRGLAAAGVATLVAQDAALVAVIVLANSRGGTGAIVLYNYGWQMFFLPYAVLAVPVATTAFPLLSAHAAATGATLAAAVPAEPRGPQPVGSGASAEAGSPRSPPSTAPAAGAEGRFDAVTATSTRAALLVSFLGAAVLTGTAVPAARVFVPPASARELTFTFIAFAPGLIGYGLVANLSRVLLAWGRSRAAALDDRRGLAGRDGGGSRRRAFRAAAMGGPGARARQHHGLTVAGVALLIAVVRARGRGRLGGLPRACAAGFRRGVAGGAAGAPSPPQRATRSACSGALPAAALTVVTGVVTLAVFLAVAYLADSGDLRTVTARVLRRRRHEPGGGTRSRQWRP